MNFPDYMLIEVSLPSARLLLPAPDKDAQRGC